MGELPAFPMNMSMDRYIDGLERSTRELPAVLAEWDSLDPELCDEYADQLMWLLRSRPEVIARAKSDNRDMEMALRIATATATLFQLRDEIRAKMGIPTDRIVPYVTFSESVVSPPCAMAV